MNAFQISDTFAEIRATLDPDGSYIVVEGEVDRMSEEALWEVLRRLPVAAGDITDANMFCAIRTGRRLLLARLAPGRGACVKEKILSQGLGPHLTLYFYGRRPGGKGHDIERL
jgi:hypothetical protein